MELNKIYFYTSTILEWKLLLAEDRFKQVIINSLCYLTNKKLISIYSFVIMPNHIHLILEMHTMNGKELPHESFMKFTGHEFKKMLSNKELESYKVESATRNYQFWKRASLPVELYSRKVIEQKLDYIHHNPVQGKWNLCKEFVDYKYSSAAYYESGRDDFGFISHYMDRI